MVYDSIIIGMGPAGMSAALNLRRANRSVLLLEKESIGGQIASSPRVENIPSFIETTGLDFANNFFDQLLALSIDYELEEVIEIKKGEDNIFSVFTNYKNKIYQGKTIIIANGVKSRKFNLPNEDELIGKGVSFCVVCDGAFYTNQDVCVIGDANTALQYSLSLANICKKVYLYTLFDKFFADQILIDRLKDKSNVIVKHNLSLKEIVGKEKLEKLIFTNTVNKNEESLEVQGLFIAIGKIPGNDAFKDLLNLDHGYIVTNEKMETSVPGIYAVGDTRKKSVKQVVTACNDGCIAAVSANDYLNNL